MSVSDVRFGTDGLVPVVVVDARSGEVLTLAHANAEALARTLAERTTWLYSRSRASLWRKGETSGNTQRVIAVDLDCDGDALVYRVDPSGPACHTGERTCFHRNLLAGEERGEGLGSALERLARTIDVRRSADPESSYTARLIAGGVDRIGKKIGEEATEVVIAAKNGAPDEIAWEVADLFYHTLVLLAERGVATERIAAELAKRAK